MKKNFLETFFITINFFIIPVFSAYLLYFFHHAQFNLLHNYINNAYTIYDKYNNIIEKNNPYVTYQYLPQSLINACISIEDTQFFKHNGISITSMIRSLIQNIKNMRFVQGGSTITQQLIKVYKGNFEKTIMRKITDILLALLLETIYSKEAILEAYFNIIYLGKNITGVAQCAKILFNKEYTELDVDESAMIAGIIKRPEYYNPLKNYDESIKRRNLVLKRMFLEGFLNKKEYQYYLNKKTIINYTQYHDYNKTIHNHITDEVAKLLLSNNHVYDIYTSIDQSIQKKIYSILEKYKNKKLKNIQNLNICAVAIDITDGSIASIVEMTNSTAKKYSPLYHQQHIASLIKPIIFYYAATKGDHIKTIYQDQPLDENIFANWQPQNHYKKYLGPISGFVALEKSNNIAPINILYKHGLSDFITFIQPYFQKTIPHFYSIALGCIQGSIFEVSTLYYHFFASLLSEQSSFISPYIHAIVKIIKRSGGIVHQIKNNIIENKFHYQFSNQISLVLKKIGTRLMKRFNPNSKKTVYAKTGTTNHATCCWSICSDLKYLVVVFISSQNNEKLYENYHLTSSKTAMPINIEIMNII